MTTLVVLLALAGVVAGFLLSRHLGAKQHQLDPADDRSFIPAENFGARAMHVRRERHDGPGRSSLDEVHYDTVNVMSPEDMEVYEAARERREERVAMRRRGYLPVPGGQGYAHVSALENNAIESRPRNLGASAAKHAQALLQRYPDARVRFSMQRVEAEVMENVLGPRFVVRTSYIDDGNGEVIVLRHPKANAPIPGIPDDNGSMIVDPTKASPDWVDDPRFRNRFVRTDEGWDVYSDPQF